MLRFDSLRWASLLLGSLLATVANGVCAFTDAGRAAPDGAPRVAILVYHRFGDTASDSMTIRVSTFEAHLTYLGKHGIEIVPLRQVVEWMMDRSKPMPPKAVALTVDDGHRSVYDRLLPIVERGRFPVTLFVYPSAISNAGYALTWEQLRELHRTGLFDVQSHTWWHPNFFVERRRQSATQFHEFVAKQLIRSRERIELELGSHVDTIAWPFGLYDDELLAAAAASGYVAGFTLDARRIEPKDRMLALPRFLIVDTCTPAALGRLLGETADRPAGTGGKP